MSTNENSSTESLGQELYSSSASFGKILALLSAIIGTVVGVGMIAGGIYILSKKRDTYSEVLGKIIQVNGENSGSCSSTLFQGQDIENSMTCTITVTFNYNGKTYQHDINYNGVFNYSVGHEVKLYIKNNNANDVVLSKKTIPVFIGWILIAFALLIVLGGWLWYWVTTKSKIAAAAGGVGGLLGAVSGGRI